MDKKNTTLLQINPILPVDDMTKTLAFYTDKLGFSKVYDSTNYGADPINYAVLCRENICIHLQLFDSIEDIIMPQFRILVRHHGAIISGAQKIWEFWIMPS